MSKLNRFWLGFSLLWSRFGVDLGPLFGLGTVLGGSWEGLGWVLGGLEVAMGAQARIMIDF